MNSLYSEIKSELGTGLAILCNQQWHCTRSNNLRYFMENYYNDINLGLWISSYGKHGNIIGTAWLESIYNDINLRKFHSSTDFNEIKPMNAKYRLKFFWAEIGSGKLFAEQLRDQLKPQAQSVIYSRIKNGKRITKSITCNDATTFMSSSKEPKMRSDTSFLQTAAARDFYLPTYNIQKSFTQRVGEMALLMSHAPMGAASPVKPVLERIQTCARLEQHRFYTSTDGTNTGLLTWAWLKASHLTMDSFDIYSLRSFEWSEGPHLAILDIVMSSETEALVWADLAGQLYPDEDIWILCQNEKKIYFKKWNKYERNNLLKNTQARTPIVFGTWKNIFMESSCMQ